MISEGVNIYKNIMDVGVRVVLPVATKEEAKIVVDKIINYTNNTKKDLGKICLLFGDDGIPMTMEQSGPLVQK